MQNPFKLDLAKFCLVQGEVKKKNGQTKKQA